MIRKIIRFYAFRCAPAVLFMITSTIVRAQDPVLPPTNLGSANVFDGVAGKPGFVYQGFLQVFSTKGIYDPQGMKIPSDLRINSVVQISQLIYLSPVKVFDGNLAFTVLVPVVQIAASGPGAYSPAVNPKAFGDPILGTAVQWSDKKLFGLPFSHRAEFDITLPAGNYNTAFEINPSSHLWGYSVYHAFTLMLAKRVSISTRNQLNLNSDIIGSKVKPGAFYNGNYSVDYAVLPQLRIEAVGYYLKQIQQDSFQGDHNFYQDTYRLGSTKESVFGLGAGLAFFAPHGVLVEAKVFFETSARNRVAGTRSTLRVTIPFHK